jgi:2-hydroxychromene-2-carboxylate isomerase
MVPRVQLWFEFASTYSYPAIARIAGLEAETGVEIAWKPFLLGPIFRDQGWNDSPFNIYPAKGGYMWRDLERTCAKHGLPFRRPSVFPRNGLAAARVAWVASAEGWCDAFAPAVYRANFADDRDIATAAVLAEILGTLGKDATQVLAQAQSPAVKEGLRAQTERARQLGIFGAPTVVAGEELFWGNDRLEDALAWAARADLAR